MGRRTLLLLAFVPLLLLLGGVGAYYAWGGTLKRRYHQRLDAIRAAGEPVEWVDLFEPPVAPEDNGAAKLLEAQAFLDAFEREILEEDGLGPDELGYVPFWDEDTPWLKAERDAVVKALDRLTPYRAKLDEVLAHPVLELPTTGPFGDSLWGSIQAALGHWELMARVDATQWAPCVDRMLGLLSRWRDRTGMRPFGTFQWRAVLGWIQEALQAGDLPDADLLGRWGSTLAAEAADLVPALSHLRRIQPVYVGWEVNALAQGRNPCAPLAEDLVPLEDLAGMEEVRRGDEDLDRFLTNVSRWERGLAVPPWYTNWWGRPFLWHGANRSLDRLESWSRANLANAAAIRRWLGEFVDLPGSGTAEHVSLPARIHLHHATALHLARLALAVHDFTLVNGRLPEDLLELAPLLGDSLPEDPLTGEAFRYEVLGGEAILQTDPDGALIRLVLGAEEGTEAELLQEMEESALRWRVPLP